MKNQTIEQQSNLSFVSRYCQKQRIRMGGDRLLVQIFLLCPCECTKDSYDLRNL